MPVGARIGHMPSLATAWQAAHLVEDLERGACAQAERSLSLSPLWKVFRLSVLKSTGKGGAGRLRAS